MESEAYFLAALGGILLLGLLTSTLGKRTFLPRVTLLLIFGAIIGPGLLNIIPPVFSDRFGIIADMALIMIGFLLGGKLTLSTLKNFGGPILWISISAAIITALVVGFGLMLVGIPTNIAVLLGCIASATAPAAVFDVVKESDDSSEFSDILLSIVALDDAWALILFAIGIEIVTSLNGGQGSTSALLTITYELGGAVILGILIGVPAAFLTGRIKQGEPILTEALGIVFLCGGVAIYFELSYLIATMVMGAVITNFAKHHEYPFHAIEGIEWPFMVAFFVLAGASLEFSALGSIGLIGTTYILFRAAGKYFGSLLGSVISHADKTVRNWMGLALLPQAGVAIGMVLLASQQFPEYRQVLLTVVISSTIFYEIIGPVFTRLALRMAKKSSA